MLMNIMIMLMLVRVFFAAVNSFRDPRVSKQEIYAKSRPNTDTVTVLHKRK